MLRVMVALMLLGPAAAALQAQETWRGIQVAPENRCAPYNREDYPYSQSIELQIIEQMSGGGGICSPYTGECFTSRRETDIEHIIALSEAHDSGLCAADAATRRAFASDLRNLTLASPELNRREKRAKDAADWLPPQNRCWFAGRVIAVRRAYALSIDRREANALERVLAGCSLVHLAAIPVQVISAATPSAPSCAEATGAQPSTDPGPQFSCDCSKSCGAMASCEEALFQLNQCGCSRRDSDGDGVPCESICPGG